jgi:hypothetical protein
MVEVSAFYLKQNDKVSKLSYRNLLEEGNGIASSDFLIREIRRERRVRRKMKAMHSSVGIALGYWLEDRGYGVQFPAGDGNFSLHHRVQNGSGAHPASCSMGTSGCFPGGKAAGA